MYNTTLVWVLSPASLKVSSFKKLPIHFPPVCFWQAIALMRATLNPRCLRGFSHSNLSRINRTLILNRIHTAPSSTPSPSSSYSPATTPSETTTSCGSRTAATVPIMTTESTGYAGYLPISGSFNPLAPDFNSPREIQPTYDSPSQPHFQPSIAPSPIRTQSGANCRGPITAAQHDAQREAQLRAQLRAQQRERQRDRIMQPSPESGGVPDPTPEYLALASHPPFLLPQPRNLLVVVDLNGTLLHRPSRRSPTRFVERPFARPFLSYCVNTFTVVIWSSAKPSNVENMCRQLLTPEDRAKVVAVWGRESFGFSAADYNQRVQCYKRLTALWNNPAIAASHPDGEKWSQLNTVLVDDSLEKARSEPFNLVQIPDFIGNAQEPGFVLPQVHDYLNDCSQQANVSAYIKGQPFQIKPDFSL
ncbi:HAD-like domain-containing protein [Xylaria venustula]|nr:HAD-like domain-containing protein [Xylaria venustula]